ncbi:WD40-repeat-containing domain protein [Pelagophyceae sp. CCMP2097]|nr:WD40-repeat-containing domain protein [Pelagophyceae sp. CCMP2097]
MGLPPRHPRDGADDRRDDEPLLADDDRTGDSKSDSDDEAAIGRAIKKKGGDDGDRGASARRPDDSSDDDDAGVSFAALEARQREARDSARRDAPSDDDDGPPPPDSPAQGRTKPRADDDDDEAFEAVGWRVKLGACCRPPHGGCGPAAVARAVSNGFADGLARAVPFQVALDARPRALELSAKAAERLRLARASLAADAVVRVDILATGILTEEPDILHPMVRLHVVDATTGFYLARPPEDAVAPRRNGVTTHFESSSTLQAESLAEAAGVDDVSRAVGHVLPVVTPAFNLRGKSVAPSWDDTVVLDLPYALLMDPKVLLLFELVDFKYIQSRGAKYTHGLFGLAWAFLRPVGPDGDVHVGLAADGDGGTRLSLRLQLYAHEPLSRYAARQARGWGLATPPPPASTAVPAVYLQFLRAKRRRYPSTLLVRVDPMQRPEVALVERRPRGPTEREVHAQQLVGGRRPGDATGRAAGRAAPDARALQAQRRAREPNEQALLPDRLLCRVVSGERGALTVRFSPRSGRVLAVASCEALLKHPIRIYDVASVAPSSGDGPAAAVLLGLAAAPLDGAVLVAELEGHNGIVYDMSWSADERFMVSASADGTAKVWAMGTISGNANDEFYGGKVQGAVAKLRRLPELLAVLRHEASTYVYCAAFAAVAPAAPHTSKDEVPPIVSGAYDGTVRLWAGRIDERGGALLGGALLGGARPHGVAHINALQVDSRSGRIYTADSMGVIVVWRRQGDGRDAAHYSVLRKLAHADLAMKSITSVALHPRRRRGQLLVQAQQSVLKLFDLTTGQPVAHYKGSHNNACIVRAVFSPDGRVVLAGSDDGKAYAWDVATADRLPLPLSHVGYNAPLCDVAWHPKQHVVAFTCFGGDHPVLVYCAPRPENPKPIVASSDAKGRSSALDPDDKDKDEKRARRLKELQARRKLLQQPIGRRADAKAPTDGSAELA